jgi:hypothetical protein
MKKELKTKRLVLCRETLVELDRLDLRQVDGGATALCEWSGRATCGTCVQTCTTNLC